MATENVRDESQGERYEATAPLSKSVREAFEAKREAAENKRK